MQREPARLLFQSCPVSAFPRELLTILERANYPDHFFFLPNLNFEDEKEQSERKLMPLFILSQIPP